MPLCPIVHHVNLVDILKPDEAKEHKCIEYSVCFLLFSAKSLSRIRATEELEESDLIYSYLTSHCQAGGGHLRSLVVSWGRMSRDRRSRATLPFPLYPRSQSQELNTDD